MTRTDERDPIRVLLLEDGGHAGAFDEDPEHRALVVIAEYSSDTPEEYATRAMCRVAALARSGKRIDEVAFAIGRRNGSDHAKARELLARGLLTHLMKTGLTKISFVGSDHVERSVREELVALAGSLTVELRGTSIEVRVRFRPSPNGECSTLPRGAEPRTLPRPREPISPTLTRVRSDARPRQPS